MCRTNSHKPAPPNPEEGSAVNQNISPPPFLKPHPLYHPHLHLHLTLHNWCCRNHKQGDAWSQLSSWKWRHQCLKVWRGPPEYASPQPDATSPGGFRDVATWSSSRRGRWQESEKVCLIHMPEPPSHLSPDSSCITWIWSPSLFMSHKRFHTWCVSV